MEMGRSIGMSFWGFVSHEAYNATAALVRQCSLGRRCLDTGGSMTWKTSTAWDTSLAYGAQATALARAQVAVDANANGRGMKFYGNAIQYHESWPEMF